MTMGKRNVAVRKQEKEETLWSITSLPTVDKEKKCITHPEERNKLHPLSIGNREYPRSLQLRSLHAMTTTLTSVGTITVPRAAIFTVPLTGLILNVAKVYLLNFQACAL